jgi:hypothetical protein
MGLAIVGVYVHGGNEDKFLMRVQGEVFGQKKVVAQIARHGSSIDIFGRIKGAVDNDIYPARFDFFDFIGRGLAGQPIPA